MTDAAKAGGPPYDDGSGNKVQRGAADASHARTRRERAQRLNTDGLGVQCRRRIGVQLRSLYDSVLQQPVPDKFRDLIERLDAGDAEAL